jgi:hypothetical protein
MLSFVQLGLSLGCIRGIEFQAASEIIIPQSIAANRPKAQSPSWIQCRKIMNQPLGKNLLKYWDRLTFVGLILMLKP